MIILYLYRQREFHGICECVRSLNGTHSLSGAGQSKQVMTEGSVCHVQSCSAMATSAACMSGGMLTYRGLLLSRKAPELLAWGTFSLHSTAALQQGDYLKTGSALQFLFRSYNQQKAEKAEVFSDFSL